MQVIIGVDPHKASHTAVAIGDDEHELARTRVRATALKPTSCWSGRSRSIAGCGRSRAPTDWGSCWRSS